jgi:hypothetical protein
LSTPKLLTIETRTYTLLIINPNYMISMSYLPEDVRIKIASTDNGAEGLIQLAEYMLKREDGQIREAKYEAILESVEKINELREKSQDASVRIILQGIAGELTYLNTKYENNN